MYTKNIGINLDVTLIYLDPIFDHVVTKQTLFKSATKLNALRKFIETLPQDNVKLVVFRHEHTKYIKSLRYKPDIIDELFKFMVYVPA